MILLNSNLKKMALVACAGLLLLTSNAFAKSFTATITVTNNSKYPVTAGQASSSASVSMSDQFPSTIAQGASIKRDVTFKHRWCVPLFQPDCSIMNNEKFGITYTAKCTVNGQSRTDLITISGTVSNHLPTVALSLVPQGGQASPGCVRFSDQQATSYPMEAGNTPVALTLEPL